MSKLRIGVIVQCKNCYGVIVDENRGDYAVEWFDKESGLKHAWWEEKELTFVIDPTTKYRSYKKEYTLTIVLFNKDDKIIEKCKDETALDNTLADLEDEINCYVDCCDFEYEFEDEFKENDRYLRYPVFDNETDEEIGYVTIKG